MSQVQAKRVTQADIAEQVGVSQAAVAMVLGGKASSGRIGKGTAERILRAAARMNYRVNPAARALVGKATGVIGVMMPHITDHSHASLAQAFERALLDRDYIAHIAFTHGDAGQIEKTIGEFTYRGVDGVLCGEQTIWELPALIECMKNELPNTVYWTAHRDPAFRIVDVDRAEGMRAAIRHLVRGGKRRIALATWSEDQVGCVGSVAARRYGYREELAALGFEVDENLIFGAPQETIFGPPSETSLGAAVEHLVVQHGADAIIGYDDYWAVGILRQLRLRGMECPDDVALIGLGDEPLGRLTAPSITTLGIRQHAIAEAMVKLLDQSLKGDVSDGESNIVITPELITRESG